MTPHRYVYDRPPTAAVCDPRSARPVARPGLSDPLAERKQGPSSLAVPLLPGRQAAPGGAQGRPAHTTSAPGEGRQTHALEECTHAPAVGEQAPRQSGHAA